MIGGAANQQKKAAEFKWVLAKFAWKFKPKGLQNQRFLPQGSRALLKKLLGRNTKGTTRLFYPRVTLAQFTKKIVGNRITGFSSFTDAYQHWLKNRRVALRFLTAFALRKKYVPDRTGKKKPNQKVLRLAKPKFSPVGSPPKLKPKFGPVRPPLKLKPKPKFGPVRPPPQPKPKPKFGPVRPPPQPKPKPKFGPVRPPPKPKPKFGPVRPPPGLFATRVKQNQDLPADLPDFSSIFPLLRERAKADLIDDPSEGNVYILAIALHYYHLLQKDNSQEIENLLGLWLVENEKYATSPTIRTLVGLVVKHEKNYQAQADVIRNFMFQHLRALLKLSARYWKFAQGLM
jgi:hypothetical protein